MLITKTVLKQYFNLVIILLTTSFNCYAVDRSYGLFDNGFYSDYYRTELGDIDKITIGDCLYEYPVNNVGQIVTEIFCPKDGETQYQESNFYSNISSEQKFYWVIENNNEPFAYSNVCNSGPPNQSLKMGTHLDDNEVANFQFDTLPSGNKRIYFALKNQFNPCENGISYTSITAHKNRGNGGIPISYFSLSNSSYTYDNFDRTFIEFNASVTKCIHSYPCLMYLNIYSYWSGKPRMLIITLGKINHPGSDMKHVHWNWPVKESMLYPGADIGRFDCDSIGIPCLIDDGIKRNFRLSIADVLMKAARFKLFDDPIPLYTDIFINGFGIAIETAGKESEMRAYIDSITIDGNTTSSMVEYEQRDPFIKQRDPFIMAIE